MKDDNNPYQRPDGSDLRGPSSDNDGIYIHCATGSDMETADSTDKGVGFPVLFGIIAVLGAAGLAAFGVTGDQLAAGMSFAVAVIAGALSVAAYHKYS